MCTHCSSMDERLKRLEHQIERMQANKHRQGRIVWLAAIVSVVIVGIGLGSSCTKDKPKQRDIELTDGHSVMRLSPTGITFEFDGKETASLRHGSLRLRTGSTASRVDSHGVMIRNSLLKHSTLLTESGIYLLQHGKRVVTLSSVGPSIQLQDRRHKHTTSITDSSIRIGPHAKPNVSIDGLGPNFGFYVYDKKKKIAASLSVADGKPSVTVNGSELKPGAATRNK